MKTPRCTLRTFGLAIALGLSSACAGARVATFETPDQALLALADVAGTGDAGRTEELFGPGGLELLSSGDEVADREDALRVKQMILERLSFEDRGAETKVALLGNDEWPFPLPLVRREGRWAFDVEAGLEELENRRVGRNELLTLATLHAYVDAQREYFSSRHDGHPPAYAQRFFSSPDRHDGLHWPAAEGEPESPFGPLVAEAASEGYRRRAGEPVPFHGYYLRILTGQGRHAPGGEKSYLDGQGMMTGGFGLLAWPARYGSSGVMTFQVNQRGIVYQRDLGPDTEAAVAAITHFDPEPSWEPTGD